MNTSNDRDWVKKGTEVASVSFGQRRSVVYSKINRIGKAWLFLDNGEKFHALGLDRQEGTILYRLYPATSSKVREVEVQIEAKKIMNRAVQDAKNFIESPSPSNAEALVRSLIPFTSFALPDD